MMNTDSGLARLLGERAASYTDSQLQQLHREMRELAELLLDFYYWKEAMRTRRARQDRTYLDRYHEDSRIGTSELNA